MEIKAWGGGEERQWRISYLLPLCIMQLALQTHGLPSSFGCFSVGLQCKDREFLKVRDAVYGHSHTKCRRNLGPHEHGQDTSCSVSVRTYREEWFILDIIEKCNGKSRCTVLNQFRKIQCAYKYTNANYMNITYECLPLQRLGGMCDSFQHHHHTGYLESPGYTALLSQHSPAPSSQSCSCILTIQRPWVIRLSAIEMSLSGSGDTCNETDELFIKLNNEVASNYSCPLMRTLDSILMTSSWIEEMEIVYETHGVNRGRVLLQYEARAQVSDADSSAARVDVKCGYFTRDRGYVVPHATTLAPKEHPATHRHTSYVLGLFIGAIMFFLLGLLLLVASVGLFCHRHRRSEKNDAALNGEPTEPHLYAEYDASHRLTAGDPPTENAPDIPRHTQPSPDYANPFDHESHSSPSKINGIYCEPGILPPPRNKTKGHDYSYAYTSILDKKPEEKDSEVVDHPYMCIDEANRPKPRLARRSINEIDPGDRYVVPESGVKPQPIHKDNPYDELNNKGDEEHSNGTEEQTMGDAKHNESRDSLYVMEKPVV